MPPCVLLLVAFVGGTSTPGLELRPEDEAGLFREVRLGYVEVEKCKKGSAPNCRLDFPVVKGSMIVCHKD
jgi:hypothetical protein